MNDSDKRIWQFEEDKKKARIEKKMIDFCGENNEIVPAKWTIEKYQPSGWGKYQGWENGFAAAKDLIKNDLNGIFAAPSNFGKSHLACAVAKKCVEAGKSAFRLKEPELYIAWMKFLNSDNKYFGEIVLKAKKCDVLVYDEIGKSMLIDKSNKNDPDGEFLCGFGAVIYSILDERAEREKRTIFTTQTNDIELLQRRIGYAIYRRAVRITGADEYCIKAIKK